MRIILVLSLMLGVGCAHVRAPEKTFFEESKPMKIILGAGDVIDLRIFDEKELSGLYQITVEGFIRLPLIGMVNIAGMDSEAASAYIAAQYQKKYLKNPDVSIFVQQSNSRKIYLLGEVRAPGPYPYEANMTLIGAIAKAGGTTGQAAANRTLISRTQNGKQVRLVAKVSDMGQGEAPDIPVIPGDIIFVPQSIF